MTSLAQAQPGPLERISNDLEIIVSRIFNMESIILLVSFVLVAFLFGRILAFLIRSFNRFLSRQADKSSHLPTVERYRRAETMLVISIALIRTALIALAIYLWWIIEHPNQQPTAIIGASAIFAVIAGGIFGPVLRDLANGSMMMSEHWFAVGDYIKVEPFSDIQGVVERVTLRSTRIRSMNGEIIWLNNQNIQGVRVTTKGLRTIAVELFVSDASVGKRLIDETSLRLPTGPLMVAKQLSVMSVNEVGNEDHNMWHITAIAQTAPGREWLIKKHALEVIHELDNSRKNPVLMSEPFARFADSVAEQKFAQAIQNARKTAKRPSLTSQIHTAARTRRETIKKRKAQKKKII